MRDLQKKTIFYKKIQSLILKKIEGNARCLQLPSEVLFIEVLADLKSGLHSSWNVKTSLIMSLLNNYSASCFLLLADTSCCGSHVSHGSLLFVGEPPKNLAFLIPVEIFQFVGPSHVLLSCLGRSSSGTSAQILALSGSGTPGRYARSIFQSEPCYSISGEFPYLPAACFSKEAPFFFQKLLVQILSSFLPSYWLSRIRSSSCGNSWTVAAWFCSSLWDKPKVLQLFL